jgi:hypothetical protein
MFVLQINNMMTYINHLEVVRGRRIGVVTAVARAPSLSFPPSLSIRGRGNPVNLEHPGPPLSRGVTVCVHGPREFEYAAWHVKVE